jgi:hypothetical protein
MNRISFLGLDIVTVGWIVLRNRASAKRAEVAYRESLWWPLPGEPHIPLHSEKRGSWNGRPLPSAQVAAVSDKPNRDHQRCERAEQNQLSTPTAAFPLL